MNMKVEASLKRLMLIVGVGVILSLVQGCSGEVIEPKVSADKPEGQAAISEVNWPTYSEAEKRLLIKKKLVEANFEELPVDKVVEGIDSFFKTTDFTVENFKKAFEESIQAYQLEKDLEGNSVHEAKSNAGSLEEQLQTFLNQFSEAMEDGDTDALYEMLYWAHKADLEKDEAIEELSYMNTVEEIKDYEVELIEIDREIVEEDGERLFTRAYVNIKSAVNVDGTIKESEEIMAIFFSEDDNPYGFILEDDMETLDNQAIAADVKPESSTPAIPYTSVELNEETKEEVEQFFYEYNLASVLAINTGDFNYVSEYLATDGKRYNEQAEFVSYMYSNDFSEEHLSTSLEQVERLSNEIWEVTTIEVFIIHNNNGSQEKTYRTVTKMKVSDGKWTMYELISTTVI